MDNEYVIKIGVVFGYILFQFLNVWFNLKMFWFIKKAF